MHALSLLLFVQSQSITCRCSSPEKGPLKHVCYLAIVIHDRRQLQCVVMSVQRSHVCFISQCQRKSVVCPGTRTGTVEVLVGSYDSALQH